MSARDLILAEGDDARKNNEKKTNSVKVRFLKKDQTFRGRFMSAKFDQFAQHGDYEKKIQSHACLDPKNKKSCVSCKAGVKRTLKTLVFWYDVDAKEIVVRDMSKTAMASVYKVTDKYAKTLDKKVFEVSMGDKGAMTILPIDPDEGEVFAEIPPDAVIDEDILSYVMGVRTEGEILELIAGKTGAASPTGEADVKIEKVDSNGPAPGPKNENGATMF